MRMNKLNIIALAACAFALASVADAIPFASKVAATNKTVATNANIDVTYFLNEAAQDVAVNLLDASDNVAATAVGTTAAGVNSATVKAPATAGAYRLQISVTGAAAEQKVINAFYSEYWDEGANPIADACPDATRSIYNGFSPRGALAVTDQDLDNFGRIMMISALGSDHCWAMNTDAALGWWFPTETQKGKDTANVKSASAPASSMVMSAGWMPDGQTSLQYSGQNGNTNPSAGYAFQVGGTDDTDIVDKTNGMLSGLYARGATVFDYGDKRYLLQAAGGNFYRAEMDKTTNLPDEATRITLLTGATSAKNAFTYGDHVYCVDRTGKKVYRFTTEQLANATEGMALPTAEWIADCAAGESITYVCFGPQGEVYAMNRGSSSTDILYLGNDSEATSSKVVDLAADTVASLAFTVNATYGCFATDPAGNFIIGDNGKEILVALAPANTGGTFATKAPLSQNITVESGAGVADWTLQ